MKLYRFTFVLALLLCLAALGCSGSDDDDSEAESLEEDGDLEEVEEDSTEEDGDEVITLPGVHVVLTPSKSVPDAMYMEEKTTLFRTTDVLPDLNVLSIKKAFGKVFAGTATGLVMYDETNSKFVAVDGPGDAGEVRDIFGQVAETSNILYVEGQQVKLLNYAPDKKLFSGTVIDIATDTPLCAAANASSLWAGTNNGFGSIEGTTYTAVTGSEGISVSDMLLDSTGTLWMATDQGVKKHDGSQITDVALPTELADSAVVALGLMSNGTDVMVATDKGLTVITQDSKIYLPQPLGIPTDHINSLDVGDDVWMTGHSSFEELEPEDPANPQIIGGGASTIIGAQPDGTFQHVDHYISHRWLPSNEVNCVMLDDSGSRWIGTSAGISKIDLFERTLEEKMEAYQGMLDQDFWRMDGFVASDIRVADQWTQEGVFLYDKDNDGLWTQMMIGAWAYAYAATEDERWYEAARKAMDAMFLQVDIPAQNFIDAGLGRGFVTRSLVRDDEGEIFTNKAAQDNWHLVTYEGHDYYWKDDTSSDEIDGHFYGYPLFYDLCAKTEEEKAAVAEHAAAIVSYIMDHGYSLIDLDGERTLHGHWSPAVIGGFVHDNCIEWCQEESGDSMIDCAGHCLESGAGSGWLNGMQILGALLSTWHMTKDQKFYDAYEELIQVYKYDEVAEFTEKIVTVHVNGMRNHSDHELAMLAYATLIRYEPNQERRQKWIDDLLAFYETEVPERNPAWAGIVSLASGYADHAEDAASTLQLMPDDLREWYINQKHRKDAEARSYLDRHGDEQLDRVLPYDEIRAMWWNGNPYEMESGGNGTSLNGPTAWLLGYWSCIYSGIIED